MSGHEALVDAMKQVSLAETDPDQWIDGILEERRPRKRVKPSEDEIRNALEDEFLTPSHSFSTEWLNKLQHRWDEPADYMSLMGIAPTMSRTVIRFTREGLEGKVTGYTEVTVPAHSITAKNSTSLLRKPASRADMVRGKAGFFPFSPGGVEAGSANERAEELELAEQAMEEKIGRDGLLRLAPGMSRGLRFDDEKVDEVEQEVSGEDFKFGDVQPKRQPKGGVPKDKEPRGDKALSQLESIDDLLPVEFPMLAPRGDLFLAPPKPKHKEWAHMVNINQELTNFHELVPNMAREWSFELDTFQKEAVYHLEQGDSVFVAAHTSAGKTVVAEYAIALAAKHMTKAIYTSPIKALSNQKFRDFRHVFDDVGILTGDVQINPEASCLIMTTEILRSMLYRGADLIRDVEFVIFDEVHYVNDLERGVVWEEVIIMLPDHVNLILLSATVPNTQEFASWVGRTKKKDIYVIATPKRPVPLEHYLWANKTMFKIVNAQKQFLMQGWKDAGEALKPKKDTRDQRPTGMPQRGGPNQRGGQRGGGPNQRGGRGGGQQRGQKHQAVVPRQAPGSMRSAAQDKNIWVHLVQHLKKENLLPGVIFVFSKKRCEENADALSNIDYCNQTEKSAIHMIIEKSIARLKPDDRQLPQIRRMRELLGRGLAVHHGGLLPIVKEVVEILFAKTLVKVLFATETFAMGLNLPTRTVVFSGIRKHDGRSFRDLLPGEYIQMAGRAGRRGIDTAGTVIVVSRDDEPPNASTLKQMILGDPTRLQSQFRLTYNMILNLLRVEALKIEEMIKRSFSENTTQMLLPEHERKVQMSEADLKKLKREPCDICDVDLEQCHLSATRIKELNAELMVKGINVRRGPKLFVPGRLVVVLDEAGTRTVGVLTSEGIHTGPQPLLRVLMLKPESNKKQPEDLMPFTLHKEFGIQGISTVTWVLRGELLRVTAIEHLTKTLVKFDVKAASKGEIIALDAAASELSALTDDWNKSEWAEVDWTKIKDLAFQEIYEARKKEIQGAVDWVSRSCPDFKKHFAMRHEEYTLNENITQLKQLISDQNLQLLPDYEQRVAVLKELSFIDENSSVQLKGRVACEVNSAHELVLTELVLENFLAEYEPEEIVALLSAFVFQEKTDIVPNITPRLEKGKAEIIAIAKRINGIQEHHQVLMSSENDDFESRSRFNLMEVVYEWAKGMPFSQITDLTDVLEGTIVRVITRLDETCREVKSAARIIGDPSLFTKMQECQELIKRDVCHCASLYL
ncbi:NUC185 domain-containing protein [Geopyxis carbonaria]|nr:NUC185 domain-containing protein [Geopyxis carbonaria]